MLFKMVLFACVSASLLIAAPSAKEEQEVQKNLLEFYSFPLNPELMNRRPAKYSYATGAKLETNASLKLPPTATQLTEFERMAQRKSTFSFQKASCRLMKKHIPDFICAYPDAGETAETIPETWAGIEVNDRVLNLARSWTNDIQNNLDAIPNSGETKVSPWSDDYWKIKWGVTSYRYSSGQSFSKYQEAVSAYAQPAEWRGGLESLNLTELSGRVTSWSPSEKYDLTVGDTEFGLTEEQKGEGSSMLGPDGDVESWMGICHGWAAAAIIAPRPNKSTEVSGASGVSVKWYPHDIRALTSLAWANGEHANNFIGGRCGKKNPERFENGRVKAQECFDNNPASFHLALGNLVGRSGISFVMDAAFDYEVWNQPLRSYEFTYFNPTQPTQQSQNWKEVAVAYNEDFKKTDRFQKPLTRGTLNQGTGVYDDSKIQKVVGVIARIVYLGEVVPVAGDVPKNDQLVRVTYTYDLELVEEAGITELKGGEWHSNAHPDFLWVPRKGSVAKMPFDREKLPFSGIGDPDTKLTRTAQEASRYGYPLCVVVAELLKRSGTGIEYRCPLSD